MEIAFVENRQDHVHDEDGQRHQDRQIAHRVLKRQRFALQTGTERRRHHFGRSFGDEVGGVADGNTRLEIEVQGHAGELIQMVDRLRTDR